MRFTIEQWLFADDDHLWLEDADEGDYVDHVECFGCGSQMTDIAIVLGERDFVGLKTGICPSCGFVQKTRNLSNDWYFNHFSKRWLTKAETSNSDQLMLVPDQFVLEKLEKYIPPGGKVLDAGCGIGQRLLPFQEKGYQAYGFDPTETRVNQGASLIENLSVDTAENYLAETTHSFDLIYFFNVLQFLENPFEVLRKAVDRLDSNGLLFLNVGAFYKETNFCHFAHLGVIRSFLTLGCLIEHFETLGLKIIDARNNPMEVILRKGASVDEVTNSAAKYLRQSFNMNINTMRDYAKRTLPLNRLRYLGNAKISQGARKIWMKNQSKGDHFFPVYFVHENKAPKVILK